MQNLKIRSLLTFEIPLPEIVKSEIPEHIQTCRTLCGSLKVRKERCWDRQKILYGYLQTRGM